MLNFVAFVDWLGTPGFPGVLGNLALGGRCGVGIIRKLRYFGFVWVVLLDLVCMLV